MRWDIFRQLRQRNLVEDDQEGITLVRSVVSDLNHGDRYQLDYLGENVGKLEYRTCSICGEGTVLKISVYHQVKGCGVGGYLIRHLVQRDPDLVWNTTWQYPDAEGFWRHMSEACRQPFAPVGKNCDHANSSAGLLDGYTFRVPHRPVAG